MYAAIMATSRAQRAVASNLLKLVFIRQTAKRFSQSGINGPSDDRGNAPVRT